MVFYIIIFLFMKFKLLVNSEVSEYVNNEATKGMQVSVIERLKEEVEDKTKKINKLQEELNYLELELEDAENVWELKLRAEVMKQTKKLNDENQKLIIENNKLKSENNILNKAFKELGFDVKDMKDILNKLVDWVIAKNTVNVVK